jgi:hypothetical protein
MKNIGEKPSNKYSDLICDSPIIHSFAQFVIQLSYSRHSPTGQRLHHSSNLCKYFKVQLSRIKVTKRVRREVEASTSATLRDEGRNRRMAHFPRFGAIQNPLKSIIRPVYRRLSFRMTIQEQ